MRSALQFLASYVAVMLHVADDSGCQPLKMLGNFMQHMQHEKAL